MTERAHKVTPEMVRGRSRSLEGISRHFAPRPGLSEPSKASAAQDQGTPGSPFWGTDVSNNNGVIDWSRVKREGVSYMFAKASEGTYFSDSTFASNMSAARKAGLIVGAYHFLTGEDPAAQLRRFLSMTSTNFDDCLIMVDVEWASTNSTAYIVGEFCKGLAKAVGNHPIFIYSAWGYWHDLLGDPSLDELQKYAGVPIVAWDAHYPVSYVDYISALYHLVDPSWYFSVRFGGRVPPMVQHCGSGALAGGVFDGDAWPHSLDDLKKLGKTGGQKPPAPPSTATYHLEWDAGKGQDYTSQQVAQNAQKGVAAYGVKARIVQGKV